MITRQTKALILVACTLAQGIFAATAAKATPAKKPQTTAAKPVQVAKAEPTTDLTVRYVNTMEAMQTSEKGQQIGKELEETRQKYASEIKKQEQTITQAMNDFKTKEATMSSSARSTEEARILKMRREFESTVKGYEEELKLAMQRKTEELSLDVEKSIVEIAQQEGYDVVIDGYTGRVIHASDKALITQDLVNSMNKKFKAPARKTA